ncbi:MAG: hypothetical protein JWO50_863 [Candidatus Kaiserbacteria bacterium]|nr:hypothetical protein [Candidatus Kaiserbacteria bacterium]
MKFGALFGQGIVIYAVMYLALQIFAIHGFSGLSSHIVAIVILVIIATIAGRSLKFRSWTDIAPYSFFWMLEVIAIDAIVTLPYVGTIMYSDWRIWVGYVLVALFPLCAPYTQHRDDLTV